MSLSNEIFSVQGDEILTCVIVHDSIFQNGLNNIIDSFTET